MTADMVKVVLGANDSFDLTMNGATYRLDVDVEPVRERTAQAHRPERAFTQLAHACGTHKLVATAQACVDRFEMDVAGSVALLRADGDTYEEVAGDIAVTGTLEASSTAWATLTLKFADGSVVLRRENSTTFVIGTHDLQALVTE
jgi:hypothetical protein